MIGCIYSRNEFGIENVAGVEGEEVTHELGELKRKEYSVCVLEGKEPMKQELTGGAWSTWGSTHGLQI